MATIVRERVYDGDVHHVHDHESEGSNSFWALIILLIVLLLFFAYGLPALRNGLNFGGGTNINVPKSIDVNVNQPPTK